MDRSEIEMQALQNYLKRSQMDRKKKTIRACMGSFLLENPGRIRRSVLCESKVQTSFCLCNVFALVRQQQSFKQQTCGKPERCKVQPDDTLYVQWTVAVIPWTHVPFF